MGIFSLRAELAVDEFEFRNTRVIEWRRMKEPAQRKASRLILLDLERRVLLFRHRRDNGETFWAPPGGGLEGGETFKQAALREASEELGMAGFPVTLLWERTTDFVYMDNPVKQHECLFLIQGELPDLSDRVRKVHDQEGILEMRWWTASELESTSELVYPEEIVAALRKISNSPTTGHSQP
jgi:8-oxo-dGTP pyrophosphatase MutT (NUDIX family)